MHMTIFFNTILYCTAKQADTQLISTYENHLNWRFISWGRDLRAAFLGAA